MGEENMKDVPLLGNLDSEPQITEMGGIDYDVFGVYDEGDRAFLLYWDLRDTWFARKIMKKFQRTSIGINGRGRTDAIHGESVKHGSPADVNAMMKEPGILDRALEVVQPGRYEKKEKKRLGINDEPV
jgi:hypothetical protein